MDSLLSILLYFPCGFSLNSVNGWIPISAVSCVGGKEGLLMVNIDIFQLFFNYLEERPYNNVYQNVKQESAYTAVVFRMGMQLCFSLLMQLFNL